MKPKRVQFEVDPRRYFIVDPDRLERVQDDDGVLVTIDFENEKAEYIWYGNGEPPANFPAEEDDFDEVLKLWEELGKPGSEPNVIVMKEDFPNDGEAYVVGEQMGRYFFAWGPEYPFTDELPEKDITSGESGIRWFETEEEALQEYLDAVEAAHRNMSSPIMKVMTAKEADLLWGKKPGFVVQSILRGPLKKYVGGEHVRKSAGTWLVTEEIMREVYGEPK